MSCHCGQPAISERNLCQEHFCAWLEHTVKETIQHYDMIHEGEKVLVAASGGKDSLTLLKILKELGYDVTAFCVDEGIADYREKTIVDLETFCTAHAIPVVIKTFKEEKGSTLDELDPKNPCTQCGLWRRDLIASTAKEFDVVATGHNLDDEAQAILMNVFKNHAMKPQPVLAGNAMFTRKIKPLYFIPEADIKRYAFIHDLVSEFTECRNANKSHRRTVQEFLENRERETPGAKERLVRNYLQKIVTSQSS